MGKGRSIDTLTAQFIARNRAMVAGFKVGDRVALVDGSTPTVGVVTAINTDPDFPLEVTFRGVDQDIADDFAFARLVKVA